jgi:hypothetical protein
MKDINYEIKYIKYKKKYIKLKKELINNNEIMKISEIKIEDKKEIKIENNYEKKYNKIGYIKYPFMYDNNYY